MSYQILSAKEGFPKCRDLWDELNRRGPNQTVLDSRFVGPLIEHFGSDRTLLCVSENASGPTAALVEPTRSGIWQTFQPSQAPLGMVLFGQPANAVQEIESLLRQLPGYALSLAVMCQDPDLTGLATASSAPHVERVSHIATPRLKIDSDFRAYWSSRSKNLRHNLKRQRRRLSESGRAIEFCVDRDPLAVARGIEQYGRLESAGWKAERGTAVAASNRQGAFYTQMLEGFCRNDEGSICRLSIDGRTAASDLCLERDGTMIILKTAYDPGLKGLSPGLLLHESLFERLFADSQIRVVEFYGQTLEWHRKFTSDVRDMFHLNVDRGAVVGLARRVVRRAARRNASDSNDPA